MKLVSASSAPGAASLHVPAIATATDDGNGGSEGQGSPAPPAEGAMEARPAIPGGSRLHLPSPPMASRAVKHRSIAGLPRIRATDARARTAGTRGA